MTDDARPPVPPAGTGNGGSRPVPDPTELTDRAIAKAVDSLTQLVHGEIGILTERIRGTVALTDERFEAAEKLRIEQKKDTKDAVDAALSAAKEAVKEQTTASERSIDKSETATRDQLKQQQETFAKTTEGLGDKIDDLKERISRIESVKLGAAEQRTESTDNRTALYATVGVIVTVLLATVTIVGALLASRPVS